METKIIRMQEVDSTNTFLKGMKACEDDTLIVAVADYQTAGRGQGTHTWESEPGKNLLDVYKRQVQKRVQRYDYFLKSPNI